MTKITVRSRSLHTGTQINEAVVEVLDDLTLIKLLKIGEKEWQYARTGADWDDKNEILCLDFVKLMGWVTDYDAYEVCVLHPLKPFERMREVKDELELAREVRWSRNVTARCGRLLLGVFSVRE